MSGVDIRSVFGRRLLIADGSTGTALEARAPGRTAVFLPLEEPSLVEELHRAYFEAGSDLVETATFGANERTLARLGAGGKARELNRAAALAAVRAARGAESADGRPRWVAGSVGPGEDPPSLGAATYGELAASYLPQMLGLLEGGADLVVLETCQDPLQIKAAIGALRDAQEELGLSAPFVVSATVDAGGNMLTGTGMEALAAILAPYKPLALGLNCSGGPLELAAGLEALAGVSSAPLSLMPNAGLPSMEDGRVLYRMGPEEFARATADLVRRHGVALVGGCCGTGPEHIRALARLLADRPEPSRRPPRRPALASLYEAWPPAGGGGPGAEGTAGPSPDGRREAENAFLRIGERANAAGSAAFSRLVRADDVEGQASFALAQEEFGIHALDLHLARPGRDEAADLSALAFRLAGSARAALSLDSADPGSLAAALPGIGGRPLLNSVNLEDPERARGLFRLARRYGAAVVCLALDGRGPARSVEDKVTICRGLYDLAREEGLSPEDLYFDCLTFSLASETKGFEGAAARTLAALPLVKEACPGSSTILGVGNVSYGFPRPLRPAITAVFLEAARKAGLDAAILDPGLPDPGTVDPGLRAAVSALLGIGTPAPEREAALDDILARDPGQAAEPGAPPEAPPDADPDERLADAIRRGEPRAAEQIAGDLLSGDPSGGAGRLTARVSGAMAAVGDRFAAGRLPLPRVLRSAQAAQAALKILASVPRPSGEGLKTVVMATVRGDLHDIGKNLTALILAGSGYRVVDLGVDVGTELLVRTAKAEGAAAVGLSGLLTRSLEEMRKAAVALEAARLPAMLLLGGAAVDREFVEKNLEPLRPGRVRACADAFEALRVLGGQDGGAGAGARGLSAGDSGEARSPSEGGTAAARPSAEAATAGSAAAGAPDGEAVAAASSGAPGEAPDSVPSAGGVWKPPFTGSRVAVPPSFDELLEALDYRTLTRVRWGYGRNRDGEAREALDRLAGLVRSRGLCRAAAVCGYFPCAHLGDGVLRVEDGRGGAKEFRFPVERGGRRRSVAKYFRREGDYIPFFAVTAGAELSRAARELRESGSHEEYFRLHGLSAALAEAAAEVLHARMGRELLSAGAPSAGRRYSFGFPGCPGVESQDDLLELLDAGRIGLSVTGGHQLTPEFSVTALIVPRPDAEYFSV